MSEVSTVGQLIRLLISSALIAGATGTLVDLARSSKDEARAALQKGPMSYGKWNRRLHSPEAERHPIAKPTK